MGGACGSLGGDIVPIDKIQATCEEVLTTFTPKYLTKLGVGIVAEQINKEKEPENPYKLETCPPEEEWLIEGQVELLATNLGGSGGKWQTVYVVLKNQIDDYDCFWFSSEKDKGDIKKAAGCIKLYGYWVRWFNSGEEDKHGTKHGITFDPWYDRRKGYFMRFKESKECEKWKEQMRFAAYHSPRPMHKDPILQEAFIEAYRDTRWVFPGWCGPYPGWGGTEDEHLAMMISDKCERDVMGEVYAKIPGGPLYNFMKSKAIAVMDRTVGAAVSVAWQGAQKSVDEAKPKIVKAAGDNLGAIGDKNAELKDKLTSAAADVLKDPLKELMGPIAKPLCKILTEPVVETYQKLLDMWCDKMREQTDVVIAKELARYAASWYQMGDVWKSIHAFCESNALSALDAALGDFNKWKFEDEFEDSTTLLLKNAAYTFEKRQKEGDKLQAMTSTTEHFEHDCREDALARVVSILQVIVLEPFKKKVMPKLQPILEPMNALIPEPLLQVIDPAAIMEEIIINAIAEAIAEAAEDVFKKKIKEIKAPWKTKSKS